MKISVVAGSFHFRTRRNDTRSSFHGMTGTRLKRPTLFGKGSPNGEKGGSNDLGFTVIPISHSCHSDRIPRSKVVLSHSGKKGTFRMTSERCRNEGRGGAEVGCFPPQKTIISASFYLHFDPTRNSQRPEEHKKMPEWPLNDKTNSFTKVCCHSYRVLPFLSHFNSFRAIPSFLCFQTTTE